MWVFLLYVCPFGGYIVLFFFQFSDLWGATVTTALTVQSSVTSTHCLSYADPTTFKLFSHDPPPSFVFLYCSLPILPVTLLLITSLSAVLASERHQEGSDM